MKKFDGFLICSDIDGTMMVNSRLDELFEKNKNAVKYFTDNGGKFTFITGRYKFYLQSGPLRELINVPAGIFNGAAVYDYDREEMLYIRRLNQTYKELKDAAADFQQHIKFISAPFNPYADEVEYEPDLLFQEYINAKPLKCIYSFDNPQNAAEFKAELLSNSKFNDCYISQSWNTSVELTNANATKGHAAQYIKKLAGAHTLITIGDYSNDIPMLRCADIGAAVGSATDEVKASADIIVSRCSDGAVCDLISFLDKKRINRKYI